MIRQVRLSIVLSVTFALLLVASRAASAQTNAPLGVANVIQRVDIVGGQLVATTTQGQVVPLVLQLSPNQEGRTQCPILNLRLGPIDLNLLGLQVDTSAICLRLTAQRGGGLLGDLLCAIARLLERGVPLTQILGDLSAEQVSQLTAGLRDLLNSALNNLNAARVTQIQQQPGSCPILNLTLGPLDLNLLGLRVELDNCAGGPVTVTITAVPGALLGDLLCGLLGGVDVGTTLQQLLQQVLQAILAALQAP
jgi:hypothetical protein